MKYINEEIRRIKQLIGFNIISEQKSDNLPTSIEIGKLFELNDNGVTLFNTFKDITKGCYDEKDVENTFDFKCFSQKVNDYYIKMFSESWIGPFENAKRWWKEKINTESFFNNTKTNNNYTDEETKKYIQEYSKAIDNSILYFGSPFDSKKGDLYDNFYVIGAYKWRKNISFLNVDIEDKRRIFINIFYYNLSSSEKENILVHEIQHLLDYSIKDTTPDIIVDKSTKIEDNQWNKNSASEMLKKTLNITDEQVKDIFKRFGEKYFSNSKKGDFYQSIPKEMKGFITGTKHALGVTSDNQITLDLLKPYILGEKENVNITWLLIKWADDGYKDIQEVINEFNKIAKKVEFNTSKV